jgi:hypothetical protein
MCVWSQVAFIAAYLYCVWAAYGTFFCGTDRKDRDLLAGRRPVAMATLKIVAFIAKSNVKRVSFLYSFFFMYVIQHFFICRPSDSTGSDEAGIELTTDATLALTARRVNHSARSLSFFFFMSVKFDFFIDQLPSYCRCKRLFHTEDVKKVNN